MKLSGLLLLLVSLSVIVVSPSVFAANTFVCPAVVSNVSLGAASNFSPPMGWQKSSSAVSRSVSLSRNNHHVDLQGRRIVCDYGVVKTPGGNYPVASISKPFPVKATCTAVKGYRFECGGGVIGAIGVAKPMTLAQVPAKIKLLTQLLVAPVLLTPADVSVFSHYPRYVKLRWSPVVGAASYTAEVQYNSGSTFAPFRLLEGLSTTEYSFNFIGAQSGRWRIWAKDSAGKAGTKSPWRGFRFTK